MASITRYLVVLWAVVGLMAALVAVHLGASFAAGQVWPAVLPIALVVAVLLVMRWWFGDRRLRQLLQANSPDPLVAFYRRTIRPGLLPDGDALLAQAAALAYAPYADYPSARAVLTRVAWDGRPPLIGAARASVEALLCYFESREYVEGLNLAAVAQELAATPASFPGARTAAAAYGSYVEIGHVLCGRSTDATVASLERKMAVLPTMGRLLVAWGLAVAYRRRGGATRSEANIAFIHGVAPHCRALILPDDQAKAERGIAADRNRQDGSPGSTAPPGGLGG
jgi:hypothetical protein